MSEMANIGGHNGGSQKTLNMLHGCLEAWLLGSE